MVALHLLPEVQGRAAFHVQKGDDLVLDTFHAAHAAVRDTVLVKVVGQHQALGLVGDVSKVVLGAVLALATSWWMERHRRGEDDKRVRRPLRIRVETEVHLVVLAVERFVNALLGPTLASLHAGQPQIVLRDLKPLLESFDRVQDRLHVLRNPGIEADLGSWYRRLRIATEQAANANLIESLPFSPMEGQSAPPPNQERADYRTLFTELQREGTRLLDRIRRIT